MDGKPAASVEERCREHLLPCIGDRFAIEQPPFDESRQVPLDHEGNGRPTDGRRDSDVAAGGLDLHDDAAQRVDAP